MLKRFLLILLCMVLVAAPALADGGQILDGRWLNSNIEGNVTADTPAELKDNYELYVNKQWYLETAIPEGKTNVGSSSVISDMVGEQQIALLKDGNLTGHDAELVQKLSGDVIEGYKGGLFTREQAIAELKRRVEELGVYTKG